MGKKSRSGSGMNIPDHISESLEQFFGCGSGIRNLFDPGIGIRNGKFGSGIWDKHPGYATLFGCL
jgi:hypothetical protein